MARSTAIVLGALALLATAGLIAIHVVFAIHILAGSPVRITSIVSSVMELAALATISWLFSACILTNARESTRRRLKGAFVLGLAVCVLAAASSAVNIILLSQAPPKMADHIKVTQTQFLIGSSVLLAVCFALQLLFLAASFSNIRDAIASTPSLRFGREGTSSMPTVKSISYEKTSATAGREWPTNLVGPRKSPSSSSDMSRGENTTSLSASLSQAIHPVSSKTRLLSTRSSEKRRPPSLDSNNFKTSRENSFDSWDTSSVDAANRQIVMEASSPQPPKQRFLETIPASPTVSRSPSPGGSSLFSLEPPLPARRSRSYSPGSSRRDLREPVLREQRSNTELHIHPLFRSDSPTPPPVASPGTNVMASPNAGQVIVPKQSIRSLHRMRSGSLPTTRSPLSRQGSLEDINGNKQKDEQDSIEEQEEDSSEQEEAARSDADLTPPIPDWIMSAGKRTSLTRHNSLRSMKDESSAVQE